MPPRQVYKIECHCIMESIEFQLLYLLVYRLTTYYWKRSQNYRFEYIYWTKIKLVSLFSIQMLFCNFILAPTFVELFKQFLEPTLWQVILITTCSHFVWEPQYQQIVLPSSISSAVGIGSNPQAPGRASSVDN